MVVLLIYLFLSDSFAIIVSLDIIGARIKHIFAQQILDEGI